MAAELTPDYFLSTLSPSQGNLKTRRVGSGEARDARVTPGWPGNYSVGKVLIRQILLEGENPE
ncbi:MAG: hypothetical protein A3K46_08990 [Chloroflexi bacterium RBG_13_60_9]|nr:MAG: hypothetical protein A3K46_08990 [Chloroflexi bacterium RBG_13_60_9]